MHSINNIYSWIPSPSFHKIQHFNWLYIKQQNNLLHSIQTGGHLCCHLEKHATVCNNFDITKLCVRYLIHMTGHFIFLCIWLQKRDTLDSNFLAVILAASLEIMQLLLLFSTYLNSTSFISYESTLYLSLYLKWELRYIRFRFWAAILAAILEFFILFISDITQQYFTNRKSLK